MYAHHPAEYRLSLEFSRDWFIVMRITSGISAVEATKF
jgi:hypothetical protein